jgi:SAM-dependent methyltransferase
MNEQSEQRSHMRQSEPQSAGSHFDQSRVSKEYYDTLALEFDEMDEYWANPYDSATWELENRLVRWHLGRKNLLLDLGVGFYPHVESTIDKPLVCVDISQGSLIVARRVYHSHNPTMRYVCADALSLPFADNAFEGIIAGGELINHVPGEILLREMHRVLKPRGKIILSVAMKWCLDSLYSLLDSFIGNRIGYSMTREEALRFLRQPTASSSVTWEVTPDYDLSVTLYSYSHLQRMLARTGFRIVQMRSLNLLSAIVPLPLQQNGKSPRMIRDATTFLLGLDRDFWGKMPGLRWFAGNVYLVLEKL